MAFRQDALRVYASLFARTRPWFVRTHRNSPAFG